jgi:hypothetical protein
VIIGLGRPLAVWADETDHDQLCSLVGVGKVPPS